jgi:hypothetical protein
VEHLEVVVITPHKQMSLGPTKLCPDFCRFSCRRCTGSALRS